MNILGLVCFAAVAGSGFYTFLTKGNVLTGYRLMVHIGAAAVFAGVSVAMTLFWAHRNSFTPSDWNRLIRPLSCADTYPILLRKVFFWTAVTLSVPTIASIVMAMFPLPSPNQQQDLFLIHRYCALPLAAAGLLFAYFAFVTWRERRGD